MANYDENKKVEEQKGCSNEVKEQENGIREKRPANIHYRDFDETIIGEFSRIGKNPLREMTDPEVEMAMKALLVDQGKGQSKESNNEE